MYGTLSKHDLLVLIIYKIIRNILFLFNKMTKEMNVHCDFPDKLCLTCELPEHMMDMMLKVRMRMANTHSEKTCIHIH